MARSKESAFGNSERFMASATEYKKRANIRSLLRLMMPYMKKRKIELAVIIALVVVSNIMLLTIPTYTGGILDAIGLEGGHVDFDRIFSLAGTILAVSAVAGALECARNIIMTRVSQSIVYDLRQTVFTHLLHLPLSFLEANKKGDIISRISVDIDQISETITSDVITVLTGAVTVAGALGMMLRISPLLTCIFAVMLPLIMLVARYISGRSRVRYREKKIKFGALTAHAEEMTAAQKTIKLFGLEQYNDSAFGRLSAEYKDASQSAEFSASTMMPSMSFLNNSSFLLISLFGCLLYLSGGVSIGSISSFIVYSKKFTSPIVETANLYGTFQSALASCDRINFLLAEKRELNLPNPIKPKSLTGDVVFDHVTFSYTQDVPAVEDVSFRVRAGQKVAIVGHTGSGKTTLVNLLMRFFETGSGTITIDGVNVNDFELSALRRCFALVLQQSFLFEMTLSENVDYGAETGDKDRILSVLGSVGLKEFADSLPDGQDTMLMADTGLLSQGQKQLLTIARAMMTGATMVIFDEATSSVDTLTEEKIRDVTERLMQGKTSFVIAHRLSTIKGADLILVMDHGRLVEHGTHEELLYHGGLYASMYHSQFQVT